jgi:hypothetical protein
MASDMSGNRTRGRRTELAPSHHFILLDPLLYGFKDGLFLGSQVVDSTKYTTYTSARKDGSPAISPTFLSSYTQLYIL